MSGCLLPQVNAKASQVECAVQGLLLDELELASLRGEVQEALLSLNLESRLGRAVVSIAGPRFSGLQGQSLSGAFRWERDVVRLERLSFSRPTPGAHLPAPSCLSGIYRRCIQVLSVPECNSHSEEMDCQAVAGTCRPNLSCFSAGVACAVSVC